MRSLSHKKLAGDVAIHPIKGSKAANNPEILQTIRERFNLDYHNPPITMPHEDYLEMLEYLRQVLFPEKNYEAGYEALGVCILQGHFQGVVGQVNRIAARIISAEKSIEIYLKANNNAVPFGQYTLDELGKHHARYRQTGVPGPPALERGIVKASIEATGAKNVRVTSVEHAKENIVYEITWE